MLYSFEKNFEDLPRVIPLFPLSNVLILPRSKLPLNLFENRYLHMFDYALENGRIIGLIQPRESNKNPNKTMFFFNTTLSSFVIYYAILCYIMLDYTVFCAF